MSEPVTTADWATHWGISTRQARRRLIKQKLAEPRRFVPKGTRARILALVQEGVPASWVAKDVGEEYDLVRAIARRAGVKLDPEWARVRLSIVNNPALRALHEEFAP